MAYHAWFIGPVSTSSSTTPTRFHGSYDGSRPLGSSWESGELRFNDDGVMFDAAVGEVVVTVVSVVVVAAMELVPFGRDRFALRN
ncbi:hypothetical protein PVK06_040756 [Gossypium arboreum]|uniref:Uncharacterized protein n=1 Tax=Gossypium arboreum TaxID=29729 RepID=A0ABR0N6B3_GOSAR|nr:hypothetical protein PVK06_040756 [Gossypium arboreum]